MIFRFLLIGMSFLLWNCDKDENIEIISKGESVVDTETVTFEEAINYFNTSSLFNKKQNRALKEENPFVLSPDWSTLDHFPVFNTDALITNAKTIVNRAGNYSSELML